MKWCDFSCEFAAFPDAEMLGACRTVSGVYCKKLGEVVPKHTPCRAEERERERQQGEGK
jgi:hypothetical protein